MTYARTPDPDWRALAAALDTCTRLNHTPPGPPPRGGTQAERLHPLFAAMQRDPAGLIRLTDELIDSSRPVFPDN